MGCQSILLSPDQARAKPDSNFMMLDAALKRRPSALITVVGVDTEAEDGVHFNWLLAAHGGTELPTGKGGHDFRGHGGGAGFEDLQMLQVAGSVQRASDDEARVGKVGGKVGAQALWTDQRSSLTMRGGIGFGELHDCGADWRIHVDGVVVAGELAIEIKRATGARGSNDGDRRAFLLLDPRASGKSGLVAPVGSKAGKIHDVSAAAANVHAGDGGNAGGCVACAAGAGRGRNSSASVYVGTYAGSGLASAAARSC